MAHVIMDHAVSPKTLSNYGAGILRFTQFCKSFKIPEEICMPAPKWLISIFITTHGAGLVGGGTIRAWLLGLELWHVINGTPWHGATHLKHPVRVHSM